MANAVNKRSHSGTSQSAPVASSLRVRSRSHRRPLAHHTLMFVTYGEENATTRSLWGRPEVRRTGAGRRFQESLVRPMRHHNDRTKYKPKDVTGYRRVARRSSPATAEEVFARSSTTSDDWLFANTTYFVTLSTHTWNVESNRCVVCLRQSCARACVAWLSVDDSWFQPVDAQFFEQFSISSTLLSYPCSVISRPLH